MQCIIIPVVWMHLVRVEHGLHDLLAELQGEMAVLHYVHYSCGCESVKGSSQR